MSKGRDSGEEMSVCIVVDLIFPLLYNGPETNNEFLRLDPTPLSSAARRVKVGAFVVRNNVDRRVSMSLS